VKEPIDAICIKYGIAVTRSKDKSDSAATPGEHCYRINNVTLVDYFLPLSVGAIHKSLPAWAFQLPREQARQLIHGMMLGDGHVMENGTRRYDTSSPRLRDDFQRLCLHAGWAANCIVKYKAGKESVCKTAGREGEIFRSTVDAFRITIIEKQLTPLVNKNIKPDGSGRCDSRVAYKGKVYCCRVSGPGVVYVRRGGTPVWCGNSRHGQKGTCGMIMNPEDMPQTANGIVPDIIINPHCIPSRMTIAHLMETLMGRICAETGTVGDGSPFTDVSVEGLSRILRDDLGLEPHANEILYSGLTGKQLETSIFTGPIFYQRLKHMVDDKVHSRSSGPTVMLTRQPAEGRARDGGLRFGEMERDCVVAHGASEFLKEIMMEKSDNFQCYVCKSCGLLGKVHPNAGIYECTSCETTTEFAQIRVPYAYKLFLQELESMSICSRLLPESRLRTMTNDVLAKGV
jgi:ribosomal protein L37AE/L43A